MIMAEIVVMMYGKEIEVAAVSDMVDTMTEVTRDLLLTEDPRDAMIEDTVMTLDQEENAAVRLSQEKLTSETSASNLPREIQPLLLEEAEALDHKVVVAIRTAAIVDRRGKLVLGVTKIPLHDKSDIHLVSLRKYCYLIKVPRVYAESLSMNNEHKSIFLSCKVNFNCWQQTSIQATWMHLHEVHNDS